MDIPVTAIIPTFNRFDVITHTLLSLSKQVYIPAEIIIIDASDNDITKQICSTFKIPGSNLIWHKAILKGAAVQRNQGVEFARYQFILFLDDDIILEDNCIERLWNCITLNNSIGGVNAMITNQKYLQPGKVTRCMYHLMHGQKLASYAGKCIGPAWNLLPEDDANLPECCNVEWLNTTCTIYHKESLPSPVFPENFKGYSLMEDLCLSLIVGRKYRLMNVRTARIYHDSQPGAHKNNKYEVSKMELINRHFIMSEILHRRSVKDYLKLVVFECFGVFSSLTSFNGIKALIPTIFGKISGFIQIISNNVKKN